ncbi:MAG: toll/interleukin-1 receptor domain-containing protein [Woeseia sp.]
MILCPRVFLSYAHESVAHKKWVIQLATWLRVRNIAVVYDYDHYRGRHLTSTTAAIMAFIQRMQCCHAFIPIFTPTYLAGIGHGPRPDVPPDKPDSQWVFDEFQLSLQLGAAKRIETVPILRAGDLDALPRPFCATNTLDLRTSTDLGEKLNRLAMYLLFDRFRAVVPFLDEQFAAG